MNTDEIAKWTRLILEDETHYELCACEGWPVACVNDIQPLTFSVEDVVRVAAPLIIEEWNKG